MKELELEEESQTGVFQNGDMVTTELAFEDDENKQVFKKLVQQFLKTRWVSYLVLIASCFLNSILLSSFFYFRHGWVDFVFGNLLIWVAPMIIVIMEFIVWMIKIIKAGNCDSAFDFIKRGYKKMVDHCSKPKPNESLNE